ncbi:hypothetical protein OH77DRAFT_468672 [Trametes cingulata]|nr:hypothetical protein OH77DRAFT_468672 [Trametes cingulata]
MSYFRAHPLWAPQYLWKRVDYCCRSLAGPIPVLACSTALACLMGRLRSGTSISWEPHSFCSSLKCALLRIEMSERVYHKAAARTVYLPLTGVLCGSSRIRCVAP